MNSSSAARMLRDGKSFDGPLKNLATGSLPGHPGTVSLTEMESLLHSGPYGTSSSLGPKPDCTVGRRAEQVPIEEYFSNLQMLSPLKTDFKVMKTGVANSLISDGSKLLWKAIR